MNKTAYQARETALRFCREHPLTSENGEGPTNERIAYHAIMSIVRGLDQESRDAIAELLVDAATSEYNRGWTRGWNASFESMRDDA